MFPFGNCGAIVVRHKSRHHGQPNTAASKTLDKKNVQWKLFSIHIFFFKALTFEPSLWLPIYPMLLLEFVFHFDSVNKYISECQKQPYDFFFITVQNQTNLSNNMCMHGEN